MIIIDNTKKYANIVTAGKYGVDSTEELIANDIKGTAFDYGDIYKVDDVDATIEWIRDELIPADERMALDILEQGEYELGYECELFHGDDGELSYYSTFAEACDALESIVDDGWYTRGYVQAVLMTYEAGEYHNISDTWDCYILVELETLRRVHNIIK